MQSSIIKTNAISFKREAEKAEKEIGLLVKRIMDTQNPRVISAYEERIDALEKHKAVCQEKAANTVLPKHRFEDKIEPLLLFLANPHKL